MKMTTAMMDALPSPGMRADFIGYLLNTHTLPQTLDEIDAIIADRRLTQHCVLNAYKLFLLNRDPEVAAIVKSCSMIQADGMSIVWIADLLGLPPVPRVTGIDLMDALIARAAQKGHKIYFLGARPEIIKKTVDHYVEQYPGLQVAGYHHGYYKDEADVVQQIRASKADILLVGFSSPQKEKFIHRNLNTMNVPFCMGVGGSFDVMSGLVDRAPRWIQNIGMEWFYRLAQEPGRLWKRYAYCHLDLAGQIGRAFLTSIRPWQRLGFLVGTIFHVLASFGLTAMQGQAGISVCIASLLLAPTAFKFPVRAFQAFLFFIPAIGVLSYPHAISLLLAPFSLVFWSFIRNRTVLHQLRFLNFPGKKYLYLFFSVVLLSSLAALGRYGLMAIQGVPASTPEWGASVSAVNACGWVTLMSLQMIDGFLLFLMAIFMLKQSSEPVYVINKWMKALMGGFLITLLMGVLQKWISIDWGNSSGFFGTLQINSTFSDPNALAFGVALFIPLLAAQFYQPFLQFYKKIGIGIFLLGMAYLLFNAGSRSALLEVAVMSGILVLLLSLQARSWKPVAMVAVMAMIFIGLNNESAVVKRMLATREKLSGHSFISSLSDNRKVMWQGGWEVFKDHLLLGTGPGAYLYELPKVKNREITYDNSGNMYLQLAAEVGFLGLLFWLLFMGSTLWSQLFRIENKSEFYWRPFAIASIAAMMAAFMYGPHIQFLEVGLLFWLTLALVVI